VGVVSDLLEPERRTRLDGENREEQERLRTLHGEKERKPLLPLVAARENRERVEFEAPPEPAFLGTRTLEVDVETLREYIDWQFFFHAWELKGKFPKLLEDPEKGAAATELFEHANQLLDQISAGGLLTPRGVHGFWRARSKGDDIVLEDGTRFSMLRQQADHKDGRPNRSLADYVSPDDDRVGAFAVTVHGSDELAGRYEAENDPYRSIMVKALADRLAEAFAELLHERTRREWYETGARMSNEDLIAERFRGIRPAFGYPACPDHSEKGKLFDLLGASEIGLELTETFAMVPGAAVSGLYLHHPASRYFAIGRVGRDQVEDYAERKGMPVRDVERWLSPNLAYDPG
jgi:5-methyltetrahydrofolate--homocysteine methyltransferase